MTEEPSEIEWRALRKRLTTLLQRFEQAEVVTAYSEDAAVRQAREALAEFIEQTPRFRDSDDPDVQEFLALVRRRRGEE